MTAAGARCASTAETPLPTIAAEVGGFDLVVEAAGNAELMVAAIAALRRNGVACLLGLDAHAHRVEIDGTLLGRDFVIENRVVFGSVNAHRTDAGWRRSRRSRRCSGAGRSPWSSWSGSGEPDRFSEAFGYRGVKATLRFS